MTGLRCCFSAVLLVSAAVAAGADGPFARRAVQILFPYTSDEHVELTKKIAKTAGAHGYNTVVFASTVGLGMSHVWDAARRERFLEAMRACEAAGLEPCVGMWSIGYAKESFFPIDPNLAAAAPVFDTHYVVSNGVAVLLPKRAVSLLEAPGEIHSPRRESDVGEFHVDVVPARSYCLRLKLSATPCKYENWPVAVGVRRVGAKTDYLEHHVCKVKPDGAEHEFNVYFSSLDERRLDIRVAGYNRTFPGHATLASAELFQTEPRLIVRRHGTPVTVRSAATGKVYVEGRDYAPIPRARGTWPGPWHKPAQLPLKILKGGAIAEGEELVLDCYCSFPTWGKWCSACMGAVEMDEILEKSAAETMRLVNPKVWFLSFDEVRTGGGCRDCLAIGDMAHVYAAFIRKAMATVRRLRPDAEFYVWNDLVDPYALQGDGKNAGMYSSMKGVWDLLPRDLGIGYWTYRWREEGTRFFAERGHPLLLCGYYDEKVLKRSLDWMDLAVRTPNCRGVMYCTWGNHWDLLGAFGDKMLEMDKKAKKE